MRVFHDWKSNIVVDADNHVLRWKADLPRETYGRGLARGLSRLASEHSEDALTWNLFRTAWRTEAALAALLGVEVPELCGLEGSSGQALFWIRDPDGAPGSDPVLQTLLDAMEPPRPGRQQTESDLILVTGPVVVVAEAKLGAPGARINAWRRSKPGMVRDYQRFATTEGLALFRESFNWDTDGHRFYQLMRNLLVATALGQRLRKASRLLAIVNAGNRNANGESHEVEFGAFRAILRPEMGARVALVTWQELLRRAMGYGPGLAPAASWMKVCRALRVPEATAT